ncbi:MAG: hypothetical protein H0V76_02175 [Blastocatellia bacterium]|nr:hypothetical protein [Blastocatellia bacterium]
MKLFKTCLSLCLVLIVGQATAFAQDEAGTAKREPQTAEAEAVLKKAVAALGGERYLNVKTQIGRGRYSVLRDGIIVSFQSFYDVLVYPDKNRTDFKSGGVKTVQTNAGESGWVFDGNLEVIRDQSDLQLANFKRGTRVSIDNLLRGNWRDAAELSYTGQRPGSLGKRNDVVKLTYEDGFEVEFEFSDEGLPQKTVYHRIGGGGETISEEDRYAQFITIGGIATPFIIDRYSNGVHLSRVNYESVEYNKRVPNDIFEKPATPRAFRKDLRL